jgi:hypothetical protein
VKENLGIKGYMDDTSIKCLFIINLSTWF